MASDLLFGWFLGMVTIVMPWLGLEVLKLRRQLRLLNKSHEQKAEIVKKKTGMFGWLKKSYNRTGEA